MSRPCTPSPALVVLSLAMMICGAPSLSRCEGCRHQDRTALMDFRSKISYELLYWSGRNCCEWQGVACNSRTGRVTGLEVTGFEDDSTYIGLLNGSMFLPLQELRSLSLTGLNITGCIPGAELSIMQLETLDISGNAINGAVSTNICNMKNLQDLHLRDNMLFGELPSCIGNLTSLRVLDLSNNLLTVKFPYFSFTNFKYLVKLSLGNNNLEGNLLLSSFSNHSQLRCLELASSGNHFTLQTENPTAKFSAQLEVLILRNCNLNRNSGIIPSFLLHQHALEVIDMSNNNLSGCFPSWLIENNTNLSYLIMRGNSFSGPLSVPSKVHNEFQYLDASCNKITKLPIDINITLPNLVFLNLSGNYLEGPFPSAFAHMVRLFTVDLSYNYFQDNIGVACAASISNLFLSSNSFYGSLPQDLYNIYFHLLLNDNRVTGEIPEAICDSDFLSAIDFSNNELTGSIPACLYTLTSLSILNLRGNSLDGSFPSGICNYPILEFLDVSKNNLSGPIHCLPKTLQYLHLSKNRFNGTFPFPLSMGNDLHTLDLGQNRFSGVLPRLIPKAFPKLRVLLLERNHFEGKIPNEICHLTYLCLLDLSHNRLSGNIPSCLSNVGSDDELFDFQYSDRNALTNYVVPSGSYKDLLAQYNSFIWHPDKEEFMTKSRKDFYKGEALNYMYGVDFSSNQLNGSIPESIGDMKWLRALNFSDNYLDGSIPQSLSNLSKLESLDLSHNNLAGQIPSELVALQSLEVFSVAYNNLYGPTLGTKGQFITFDQRSYEGNPYLCGPPLVKGCSMPPSTPPPEEHGEDDDDQVGDIILFGCSAMFYLVGFWTSLGVLYFKTSWRWSWFSGVDRFGDFVMVKFLVFTRKIRRTN
uniref:Uncharacterized protein n=1 Tax=Avena sativa TaxID=4498 RepID=A0ACD5ZTT8_AVESA